MCCASHTHCPVSHCPIRADLMGLFGAIAITPTTFLLPSLLWILWAKPRRFGIEWSLNALVVVVTAVIGVMGAIGSVYSIVENARTFHLFAV